MPPRQKCAVTGCEAMVPRGILMCHDDWQRVPKALKQAIYRTRIRSAQHPHHVAAIAEAVSAVEAQRVKVEEPAG